MASALAAANSRPSSESPAWKITGRPCGLRGVEMTPAMSKCASWCSNRPASASRRKTPDSLSATIAPSPGVEELPGGPQELLGPLVALVLREEAAAAEVLAGERVPGGDHVPRGAAGREVVEPGELPGDLVGLVERGVDGAGQSEVLGDRGERGQHRERVGAADDVEVVDLAVLLAQPQPFGQEEEVELGALGGLREVHEGAELDVAARPGSLHTVVLLTPGKCAARWTCLTGLRHRVLSFGSGARVAVGGTREAEQSAQRVPAS